MSPTPIVTPQTDRAVQLRERVGLGFALLPIAIGGARGYALRSAPLARWTADPEARANFVLAASALLLAALILALMVLAVRRLWWFAWYEHLRFGLFLTSVLCTAIVWLILDGYVAQDPFVRLRAWTAAFATWLGSTLSGAPWRVALAVALLLGATAIVAELAGLLRGGASWSIASELRRAWTLAVYDHPFVGITVLIAFLAVPFAWWLPTYLQPSDGAEGFAQRNEVVLTWAKIVGGAAAINTVASGWRTWQLNREGQLTDRFSDSVEHLGRESAAAEGMVAVRLGGILALERIMRDSKRDHVAIVRVLADYVRENAPCTSALHASRDSGPVSSRPGVPPDIQAAVTALQRRDHTLDHAERPSLLNFSKTDLRGVTMDRIHLEGADLREACIEGAALMSAYLGPGYLSRAGLKIRDVDDPWWRKETRLEHARLVGTHLEGADLTRAHLDGANLQGALLNSAKLVGTDLQRADLKRADLRGANLRDANLHGADLRGARLDKARLDRANLRGANLCGVEGLTHEQEQRAYTDESTLRLGDPRCQEDDQAAEGVSTSPSTRAGSTVVVNAEVRLRVAPRAGSRWVKELAKGDQLRVIDEAIDVESGKWWPVKTGSVSHAPDERGPDVAIGFVRDDYLTPLD